MALFGNFKLKKQYVVNNITERNNLPYKVEGMKVLVIDATGDPSVQSGYAEYIYLNNQWIKLAEGESLDKSAVYVAYHASKTPPPDTSVFWIDTN